MATRAKSTFSVLPIADVVLDRAIDVALNEDLFAGDVTTEACISRDAVAVAHAVARAPLVACGSAVFSRVFSRVDASLKVRVEVEDGASVKAGKSLWSVRGSARSILMGERVALNFVQRMCAIATTTRAYVDALPRGSNARICDTRKTTPGLRAFERYAVRVGGGVNHRDNLGAAILIKDNHIAACGGVAEAIGRARAYAPHTSRIECEVDSLDQLDEALAAGADIILLDNMSAKTVKLAVARTAGRAILEASGGVTLARVRELADAGVEVLSIGALTHTVASADIGLDFKS